MRYLMVYWSSILDAQEWCKSFYFPEGFVDLNQAYHICNAAFIGGVLPDNYRIVEAKDFEDKLLPPYVKP